MLHASSGFCTLRCAIFVSENTTNKERMEKTGINRKFDQMEIFMKRGNRCSSEHLPNTVDLTF